jgi:GT2 family glycosyltransferase
MQPAVAIVNYNTAAHLRACLGALRAAGAREVVVKDNGSTDDSVALVQREFPEVRVHPDFSNPGYGAGANMAIAACSTAYVVLLNSDTRVRPDTLGTLARYLDEHARAAIVGPLLLNPDGTLQRSAHNFPRPFTLRPLLRLIPGAREHSLLTWSHDRSRRVAWVKGAALAIRRIAFDAVGGFDPSFFMYFEETDLSARLATQGWETHFTPDTAVIHEGGASTEAVRSEMAVQFYSSMRRFYRRHYPPARLAQLDAVLHIAMRYALVRDRIRSALAREPARRARLAQDIHAWQRVLRRDNPERARIGETAAPPG